jgi:hypothetical protein
VYVVLAFGSALAWINIIADELVAFLTALGIILEIDSGILGLIVLAMGNSSWWCSWHPILDTPINLATNSQRALNSLVIPGP